jgi:sterol desaturase/sphingolipid hydroxylase (fatty acid hydroxylase superfamily)
MYLCDKHTEFTKPVDEIDMYENNNIITLQKSQRTNFEECTQTYNKVINTVMINTFVYSLPIIFYAGYYDTLFINDFSLLKCLFDLGFALLCIDPFFYFSHRLLHVNPLYILFHKKHHEITKPVGMSALYTSCVEFYVGNILPIFLPLYIVGSHPITIKLWLMIIVINTIIFAHSGYKKLADFHDKHHQHFVKNYGTDMFVDKLMGTYA